MTLFEIEPAGQAGEREWLLANGLGGFAMGTASGVPTRRYHAMLIGATTPPVGRVVGLAGIADQLDAEVQTPRGPVRERRALSSFAFKDWAGTFAPPPGRCWGDVGEVSWEFRPWGAARPGRVVRTLRLADRRNAAEAHYEVETPGPAWLELSPLVALRSFHGHVEGRRDDGEFRVEVEGADGLVVRRGGWAVHLRVPGAELSMRRDWWWNFEYRRDRERGQDFTEDLLCPGTFTAEASGGVTLLAWMDEDPAPRRMDPASLRARVAQHASALGGEPVVATRLAAAAAPFVVTRKMGGAREVTSIIAGYPWFSDWGRDTMIALPGLLLATGRHAEAKSALAAFAAMQRRGLVPNCFEDAGGEAQYNTVDGSLWFVHACLEYAEASKDRAGFERDLRPACLDVVRAYREGTDFDIRMDEADGLIAAGTGATQLTWMDAARDGVVFTPRAGKPVEIAALWCSVLGRLGALTPQDEGLRALAGLAGASLRERFWNRTRGCLFDRLEPDGSGGWRGVDELRPNQIYAVSLPGSALSAGQQRSIVDIVRAWLLTPVGLRSLDAGEASYMGRYEGPLFQRDKAYHNGTVWPYLIGAYAEAVLRVGNFGAGARSEAMTAIAPLLASLSGEYEGRGPAASICEVYDGDEPRRCEGCPMQAWSVAEVMRVWALAGRHA